MPTRNFKKESDPNSKGRKKMALGRGLEALIPDIGTIDNKTSDYFQCEISRIHPNRYQPRLRFPEQELKELSESIKEQGIIQPLLVRNSDTGYELIVGERRLRAARIAGLKHVPVVLKNISDLQMLEISIIENVQRENLDPIEEADAYQRLIEEFHLTQEQVAERVGKSRSAVTNFLRLRQLPEPIKVSLSEGVITIGHARALLGAENPEQQQQAWKTVISGKLSVRETEALIRRLKSTPSDETIPAPDKNAPYISELMHVLSKQFNAKVKIKKKGEKGKVEISFKTNDDFERLIKTLKQSQIA